MAQNVWRDGTVEVLGRATGDAEVRETKSGNTMAKLNLALDTTDIKQIGQRKPIYVNAVAFGRMADIAVNIRKGDIVHAIGNLETNDWNGKVYKDLAIIWVDFVSKYSPGNEPPAEQPAQNKAESVSIFKTTESGVDDKYAGLKGDEGDLPF